MNKKTKVWLAVGPFIAAVLILALLFISPVKNMLQPSRQLIREAATSMSIGILKGNAIKNKAIASNEFIPFFGSSELSRIDEFHPSVLARKYQRGYEPFLLGAPGTQSIIQYFLIDSMKEELKGKKMVFVVSPQWFVKDGINDHAFSKFYSPLQIYGWLKNIENVTEKDQYVATRLLNFSKVKSNTTLANMLRRISNKENLSEMEVGNCELMHNMLSKEDLVFSDLDMITKENRVLQGEKRLPESYDYETLDKLAYDAGKANSSSNEFQIINGFYKNRLANVKGRLKNSQKKFDYTKSPEFGDFQAVLNEISENDIDCLFVIPPVNKKWSDYTGLNEEMLNTFSKKITKQLKSQGFNNIVDLTEKRGIDYYMQDTTHIGWRGWVDLDQYLNMFFRGETLKGKSYNIDNASFLNESWNLKEDF